MLQLLKWGICLVFVGIIFYIPSPVNGNLRGTSEGTCFVDYYIHTTNTLGNTNDVTAIHQIVKSDEYTPDGIHTTDIIGNSSNVTIIHRIVESDEYTSYNSYTAHKYKYEHHTFVQFE